MSTPWTTLVGIAALALCYVIAPIVLDAFARFRRRRMVRCPATGLGAEIALDARHAALTAIPGPPQARVAACSLWPERQGCAQACLAAAGTR
jgi:hypothetical protein